MALAGTRQLRSQGLVSVHPHCTERVTGPEEREEENGAGGGVRDGGGNGDVNGDGDEDGAEKRTEVEASKKTQIGNGDGSGDEAGTGTRTEIGGGNPRTNTRWERGRERRLKREQ